MCVAQLCLYFDVLDISLQIHKDTGSALKIQRNFCKFFPAQSIFCNGTTETSLIYNISTEFSVLKSLPFVI